jgi:predicted ATPase/DNA-binding CsgD family transcriptional regulator
MIVGHATGQRGRLAAETTEFVGRTAELRRISVLLRDRRLVTLMGPGGVGKTRLALRAAEAAGDGPNGSEYRDGICLVELSAVRDPELLPHTVASRLGLPEQSPGSQLDAVLAHLRERHLLLILDTCEHLIDACALFAEAVITETPYVTVLATSREPLDVTGESCFAVPTLGLPGNDGQSQAPADAIELFALRASAVVPGFTVTSANRADVIRLCQELDGMPLAIELAAVRLKTLPLAELADRLDQRHDRRLALLTDGCPGDDRHRTLRDSIGWSYDLCTYAEQALWARLSVFAGSFGVDAAEEVCAGGELSRGQIFETVVRLVDKSVLIRAEPSDEGSGQLARYRMLDTIREFGAEQLASSGTEAATRNRFIDRYLAKARYFSEHLLDDDQLDRFRELRREHANIRAALEYTLSADDRHRDRDGAELATALYGYWHMSGGLREGRYWLAKVLDRFPDPSSPERGRALAVRGYLGAMQGEAQEAVADATEGTRIGVELGDTQLIGRGYVYLTLALTIAGRYEEARAAGERAQPPLQALSDRIGLAILDVHLAHLAHLAGDLDGALSYVGQALHRFGDTNEIKERWAQGWVYAIAGLAWFWQPGREAETAQTTSKALLAKHELGDVVGMAYCIEIHGWLADRAARHVRAAWLLGAANALWERAGGRLGGTAALEQVHDQAITGGREALGGKRFEALFAEAGQYPIDQMVAFAVDDADEPAAARAKLQPAGQLTDREAEIANLAARGMSNPKIAEHLFISRRTVDAHLQHIYAKLGISSRSALATMVRRDQAERA